MPQNRSYEGRGERKRAGRIIRYRGRNQYTRRAYDRAGRTENKGDLRNRKDDPEYINCESEIQFISSIEGKGKIKKCYIVGTWIGGQLKLGSLYRKKWEQLCSTFPPSLEVEAKGVKKRQPEVQILEKEKKKKIGKRFFAAQTGNREDFD